MLSKTKGVEVQLYKYTKSAIEWGGLQHQATALSLPKKSRYPFYRRLGELRVQSGQAGNNRIPLYRRLFGSQGKEYLVFILQEVGWVSRPVRTRREYLAPTGFRNPDFQAHSKRLEKKIYKKSNLNIFAHLFSKLGPLMD